MTKFELKFPHHFDQQGASHPLPRILSASGADAGAGLQPASCLYLPLPFRKVLLEISSAPIGLVLCQLQMRNGPFPASFPLQNSQGVLGSFQTKPWPKSPAQVKSTTQREPSYSAQCCCTGITALTSQVLLVFRICHRNSSAHIRENT